MNGERETREAKPAWQLTGSSLERTQAVVEEVLTRAARDGERVVSWARIALAGMVFSLWPLATWAELKAGVVSNYVVMALSAAALLFSAAMLRRLKTRFMTPTQRTLSILVDAALVLGLLSAFVLNPPPTYLGIGRVTGVGAGYFAILAAGIRLSRRGALLSTGIFLAGFIGLVLADESRNHIGDTVANWVTIGALVITAGVFAWLIAARTRSLVLEGAQQTLLAERTRSRLGAYVSEEVAADSLKSDVLRLGGSRHEVAVLFSDLRSFTSRSEMIEPEQLVRELNEYFEVMVAAITSAGGVVDKYIGDSIMAVFGAPTSRPDDAARAIRAAWGMEQALVKLNESRGRRGLDPLRHGIGVHKGPAVAGNIGTTLRAQYTVIGDTVNVAARLESATKDEGVTVLLSQAVLDGLRDLDRPDLPAMKPHGEVKAKGRVETVHVHTFG